MPSILFLVHLEEQFRDHFPYALSTLLANTVSDMELTDSMSQPVALDRIVLLHSGISPVIEEIMRLPYRTFETWEWGWGYEADMFEPDEQQWVIPSYGHEFTWVPENVRPPFDFSKWNIYVGGGAECECLQDWIDVLNHLGLEYETVGDLTY